MLLNRLHDPQHWMPVKFLQREIDEVSVWVDRDRVAMRQEEFSFQSNRFSRLAKHGNVSRFCRDIQQSQTGIERPHRDELLCGDSRPRLSGGQTYGPPAPPQAAEI